MSAGRLYGDLAGHIVLEDTARELLGVEQVEAIVDPMDWPAVFHLYDPTTRMPMAYDATPGYRILADGALTCQEVLVAPPGLPERILRCSGQAVRDYAGDIVGGYMDMVEVPTFTPVEVAEANLLCPCGRWQLIFPATTPRDWIEEALAEHMDGCIVLTATRMTALASAI